MIPSPAWPDHIKDALKDRRFGDVLQWIDEKNPPNAGLLQACVYDWWGKPMDAVQALTSALKRIAQEERGTYLWYRGLLYIQANMPAWAEQDFDAVMLHHRAHPDLSRLARGYAKILLGDARGALEDVDGLPKETTLALDRVVTPGWINTYALATLHRTHLKESTDDGAMI